MQFSVVRHGKKIIITIIYGINFKFSNHIFKNTQSTQQAIAFAVNSLLKEVTHVEFF